MASYSYIVISLCHSVIFSTTSVPCLPCWNFNTKYNFISIAQKSSSAVLQCVQGTTNYIANSIWNVDESGITNVQKPGKILVTKGARQVSKMTSAMHSATVTIVCAWVQLDCIYQYTTNADMATKASARSTQARSSTRLNTCSQWQWEDWWKVIERTKEQLCILRVDGHNTNEDEFSSTHQVELAKLAWLIYCWQGLVETRILHLWLLLLAQLPS